MTTSRPRSDRAAQPSGLYSDKWAGYSQDPFWRKTLWTARVWHFLGLKPVM